MSSVLNVTKFVTFNATGGGTVSIGPQDYPGTQSWNVTGVIVKTTRPGVAPIPTIDFYLNQVAPANIFGSSYDGSRNQGPTDLVMNAGMRLFAVWAGGQVGDIGYVTVTGTRL